MGGKYSFWCMLVQISISVVEKIVLRNKNMKNDGFLYGQIYFLEKQAN